MIPRKPDKERNDSRVQENRQYKVPAEASVKEVESIFSGAGNVDLGEGYQEQLDFHRKNASLYSRIFMSFVTSIFLLGGGLFWLLMFNSGIREFLVSDNNYVLFTPILFFISGLAIWFGTFIKDKEREEQILSVEYEHKKQIIHAFVGYIKALETIRELYPQSAEDTKPVLVQFYEEMLTSVGHNPSFRMQQKGSGHLLQSILDIASPRTQKSSEEASRKFKMGDLEHSHKSRA